ncbi:MAG TPA: hypothetical protein VLX92_16620 [Kofleriaceae bacterium]|nr:hypothetical protein [Kofleriaceae bacterium]
MKMIYVFALPISLIACYGAAPPKPPQIPLPQIAEGTPIEVHSETNTTIEAVDKQASTCPAGHAEGDPACVITHYTENEPVTRTTTTASYGGQPINFAQFKVITDPKWNDKLGELDDLSTKCHRANIPRYAGMGLMLGGLVTGLVVGGSAGQAILYGGVGLGGASYALGYFAFGGRDCVEARELYNYLNVQEETAWNSVQGADYATQMKALADQFNAAHGPGRRASLDMRQ